MKPRLEGFVRGFIEEDKIIVLGKLDFLSLRSWVPLNSQTLRSMRARWVICTRVCRMSNSALLMYKVRNPSSSFSWTIPLHQ